MAPVESAPNQRVIAAWPNILGALALLTTFVALRLLDDTARTAGLIVAGLAIVGAIAGRARGRFAADLVGRRYALLAAMPDVLILVGALSCALAVLGADPPELALPLGVLAAVLGGAQMLALELVSGPMRANSFIDLRRVKAAINTASTLVLAVAGLGALCFAVDKLDVRRDFSFAAPTTPSAATTSLFEAAKCPAPAGGEATGAPEVYLFFERGNSALGEVRDYFDALAARGAMVVTQDAAVDPALAKKMKVSKNGTVGLRCGERSETWQVGEDREDASKKLGKLDEEIRTRLAKVTKDPVTVYFTVGHGERSFDDAAKPGERVAAKGLKRLVEGTNAKVKKLGLADGLSKEVPADAALVVLTGPSQPFLEDEAAALKAYLERGGSLLVLVDPTAPAAPDAPVAGAAASLEPLLAALGVTVGTHEVMNDKSFVKETGGKADHAFMFSTSFGSHKSVKTLSGARGKAALLFKQAGVVEKRQKDNGKIAMLARTAAASFVDKDDDRAFSEGTETRGIFDFAAAIDVPAAGDKEGRAVVVADSDVLADFLLVNSEANQVFGYELLVWLLRDDDKIVGDAPSSGDVRILHTREQDKLWFYGTVFLAPLVLVGAGALAASRRRRQSKRAPAAVGGTP